VTPGTPFLAGRPYRRVVVTAAVKQANPVHLLGMAFSPTPLLLQNLHMAGFGSAHDVFGQSGYRIRRVRRLERRGTCPAISLAAKAWPTIGPSYCKLGGTYVRIRTPAEIGVRSRRSGVVERRNEAHGVVVAYGFQMAPDRTYALRGLSPA
jgi:hypothetical protein